MFGFVEKRRKWIMIGILALIIPPFALFGIDSYFRDGVRGAIVAKVGDHEISDQEFSQALRERQEALRNMSGGRIDPDLLDTPELQFSVLETLVRQRVLLSHAVRSGLVVSPDQLRAYITQAPAFQEDGKFSHARYEQLLKSRNETPLTFENKLRQDLLLAQLSETYSGTSFVPRTVAERLVLITEQQREVTRALVSPERFVASVKLEDDAAKKYYDTRQDEFRIPEQVRVDYVALTLESLLGQLQVDAAEVKKFYDANQRQFGVPETRQASHILITAEKSASDEAKQKARVRAEQIHSELKKNPASFAELAKKHSQDPGSAAKGGELGSFGRGSMVKSFDDAVFSMKAGEISSPVESEFGYHIIRVTGITSGQIRSFEQARPDIEKELKKQRAVRVYAETAEKFSNTVFEQSDSLKGAADLTKTPVQQSAWITRTAAQDAQLNNPKLLRAIFSEDVLVNKRNTEAVEIAPGVLLAARVSEHKPSAMQPFEQVKSAIEKKLIQSRASQLAAQEGRQQLDLLRQGKDTNASWGPTMLVSRAQPKDLPEPVLRQAFKADAGKLPAYTGVEAPGGGYLLIRITRVVEPQKIDRAQQNSVAEALAQMLGEEQFGAYVASLKEKSKVTIKKERFEKKQ